LNASGGASGHSRDLFKVPGKPLEPTATAAAVTTNCGAAGEVTPRWMVTTLWDWAIRFQASRVEEGTQTVRKGVTARCWPVRGSLIFSRSPGKPVQAARKARRKCPAGEPAWAAVTLTTAGMCNRQFPYEVLQCSVGEPAEGSFPRGPLRKQEPKHPPTTTPRRVKRRAVLQAA